MKVCASWFSLISQKQPPKKRGSKCPSPHWFRAQLSRIRPSVTGGPRGKQPPHACCPLFWKLVCELKPGGPSGRRVPQAEKLGEPFLPVKQLRCEGRRVQRFRDPSALASVLSGPPSRAWPERGPAQPKCLRTSLPRPGGPGPGQGPHSHHVASVAPSAGLTARDRGPWLQVFRGSQAVPRSPSRSPCSSRCPREMKTHLRPTCLGDTGCAAPRFAGSVPSAPSGCALPEACGAWWLGSPLYLYLYSYVCTSNTNKRTCCQKFESPAWISLGGGGAANGGRRKAPARGGVTGADLHRALPTRGDRTRTGPSEAHSTPHHP